MAVCSIECIIGSSVGFRKYFKGFAKVSSFLKNNARFFIRKQFIEENEAQMVKILRES